MIIREINKTSLSPVTEYIIIWHTRDKPTLYEVADDGMTFDFIRITEILTYYITRYEWSGDESPT